ncbi:MAG: HlyD family efflux transporter periplasmic adaptor subunit [Pseudomonadota bacterium]
MTEPEANKPPLPPGEGGGEGKSSRLTRLRRAWQEFRAGLQRHLDVWRAAWADAKKQEPVAVPKGRELEFLPAVLEVQETPPSPAGRVVGMVILSLFSLFLIWSIFGHIDIIAIAQGKIVPSGGSKVIQPLETGVIKAIHVRDGQRVKKGDLLIEIDTSAGADRERLTNEHLAALTEVARLRALNAGKSTFKAPEGAKPEYIRTQRQRLQEQLAEFQALTHRATSLRQLLAQQYVSRNEYLEAERARAEKAQQNAAALNEAETRARSLEQDLVKAVTRDTQQRLVAPIDGAVQQLSVQTVGGVVTPAQQLMIVAPEAGHLEIEAWIENKDIGFVAQNQPAEIKIESFPFTRYGVIDGQVVSLSGDAVPVEKVGLVYTARVSLARHTMRVENGKDIRLSPGMAVTVEIKTGQRRLIEYFLSPLLRGVKEAARER